MKSKLFALLISVVLAGGFLPGCQKEEKAPAPSEAAAPAEPVLNVAPVKDFEKKAKETINEENVDQELQRLKAEIEAETGGR